ncbi:DTW domain protein [Vibrio aerogenes CECT 7868]|uniref:tRNA-uridine aminocarboxypropyltransferase n=1 Tax=Vibrio aerogenes CECT 7868 TaxID=1216006 RepID=A0A1M6DBY8_9VIBR|nr:DTW domain-containing protein [Vibrio aerogenes]SHI70683.1 DTW domain protein [Vibrio aerogenes CECT 7868]
MSRRDCPTCGKAHKACICPLIVSLASEVELIILQHPTEVRRPLGTARILQLSLPNSHCFTGENFTTHPQLNQLLSEPDTSHFVLYPGEGATCISAVPVPHPQQKVRVILLDGTWKKAYKMWQLSENLHELPRLALPENLKSNYQIRKAPREGCLSTVEAGYHLLSYWQPGQDFTPLLTCFEQMIQFQVAHMSPEVRRRYIFL